MRIAIISTTLLPSPPPSYGGLELITGLLAKELDKRGHHILHVATKGSYKPKRGKLFETGEPGQSNDMEAYTKYRDLLKEVDLVNDHSWTHPSYFYRQTHKDGPAIVGVHHGMQPGANPPPIKKPCFCVTSQHQAMIFESTWRVPVRWCHHGIDLDLYEYSEEKSKRLLWLGRMFPAKGAHLAVMMADRWKFPLDVVGSAWGDMTGYDEDVERMCKKSRYAEYHGEVSQEEKARFLTRARALLVPHLDGIFYGQGFIPWIEPFGLIFIEAMASGTPVITSNNGAAPEIIRPMNSPKYGWGWLCRGMEDFKVAVKEAREGGRLVSTASKLAREVAEEVFSVQAMTKRYLKLFRQAMKNPW